MAIIILEDFMESGIYLQTISDLHVYAVIVYLLLRVTKLIEIPLLQ